MSTEHKSVRIGADTFDQLQEMASRKGKPLDDVADETMRNGIVADFEKRLLDLAEYGRMQTEKLYPDGLTEEDIVDIIHRRREMERRR